MKSQAFGTLAQVLNGQTHLMHNVWVSVVEFHHRWDNSNACNGSFHVLRSSSYSKLHNSCRKRLSSCDISDRHFDFALGRFFVAWKQDSDKGYELSFDWSVEPVTVQLELFLYKEVVQRSILLSSTYPQEAGTKSTCLLVSSLLKNERFEEIPKKPFLSFYHFHSSISLQ